jgi:ankyrin repeat protein
MERSPDSLKLAQALDLGDRDLFNRLLASSPEMPKSLSPGERRKLVDAAQDQNIDAVRLMLEAGWPVDARGQHGGTALHWAAWHGNVEMARLILHFHPALEAEDSDYGGTPLGWAIHASEHGWHPESGDYAGTVSALLKAGARPPTTICGSPEVRAVLQGLSTGSA